MIRSTVIEKYVKSSTKPTITVADVALSFDERYQWIFSGLIIQIWQCNLDPVDIIVQSESHPNHTEQMVENPEIIIHNSSFGSLDLNPGSKAQITDCYIDAQFKPRPTLISANNSDVTIHNCHFGNFINENGSTILYGHYYSHITIENSVFIQHNSSKGVLLLANNCYMFINNSTHSHNIASSPGYSAISLRDGIHAVLINTVFTNNSAMSGGALIAIFQCKIALTNCTFSSNKAITGKNRNISKNSNLQRSVGNPERNTTGTVTPVSHTSFNQASPADTSFNLTSSDDKKPKPIAAQLLVRIPILGKNLVQQEDALVSTFPGYGGAVYVETQSQLLVTNCTFEDNSALQAAGAISADSNVMLHVEQTTFVGNKARDAGAIGAGLNVTLYAEETTFVGNKALKDGGAIDIQQQYYLRMINCVFDNNISGQDGGAISAGGNATLEVKATHFTRNSALEGGAIDVGQQAYLHTTDCTFKDNRAELVGGAIAGGFQAVLEINGSCFSNNSALQGGAINTQYQTNLSLTNCRFERNFASDTGGAILAYSNVILRIREANFTGNGAFHGGGALIVDTLTDCHIVRSVFDYNTAKRPGGAVYADSKSSVQAENTNFTNNNATDGGAIYIDSSSELQTNMCSFWKNLAKRAGGAIMLKGYSTAVIESCHFLSNHAKSGGAVSVSQPEHLSVLSTSLMRNVASDTGGAISISNGTDVIINNITCVDNQCPNGGGCLYLDSVTLTLTNSNISKNFGNYFGSGVCAGYSRIQVSQCWAY